MIDFANTTLAILAGGQSRRMGTSKSSLEINGKEILRYLLDALQWPGPTMLVTAPGQQHPPGAALFSCEAVDAEPLGPLGGVLTALNHLRTDNVIACTVDMPAVRALHLRFLLNQLESRSNALGIMLTRTLDSTHRVEPFPFACRIQAAQAISKALTSGLRAMHALLDLPQFHAVPGPKDWPEEIWTNLNYPDDLRKFREKSHRQNLA